MKKIIKEGESVPFGYFPTKVVFEMHDTKEFYPFGIHWLIKFYYKLISREIVVWGDMKKAYDNGYQQAEKDIGWSIEPLKNKV
jgi:hypothetical protein